MTGVHDQLALQDLAAFHGREQPVEYAPESTEFVFVAFGEAIPEVVGLGDRLDFVRHLLERS